MISGEPFLPVMGIFIIVEAFEWGNKRIVELLVSSGNYYTGYEEAYRGNRMSSAKDYNRD